MEYRNSGTGTNIICENPSQPARVRTDGHAGARRHTEKLPDETSALCIFTKLADKTRTTRLVQALNRIPGLDPTYVFVTQEDFENPSTPWWARTTCGWQAEFAAKKAASRIGRRDFDILLVDAWEFVVAFRDLARKIPAAVSLDATPATMNSQLRNRGVRGWKRSLAHCVHHSAFARAASAFQLWLPKGTDCLESLRYDYRVDPSQCAITLAPQDLDAWKPARPTAPNRPARLLFAGNDFHRKGGDFLLRLYSEHLSSFCTLTICSKDSQVGSRPLPPGVEWLRDRNRSDMLAIYQSSDLFIFPTRQDFTPEVLSEALSAGLPCITSNIDGLRDLVVNGETGYRMPAEAPASAWADTIRRIVSDPAELRRLSEGCRRFAENMLGIERFNGIIADTVAQLRVQARRAQPARARTASANAA